MKHLLTLTAFFFLTTTILGQTPVPSIVEKDTLKVAEMLQTLQAYSSNTSEPRSVGLYQIDSLLQGYFDPATGKYSEINYKNTFHYDERGYPLEAHFYYWNGSGFQLYSKYHFTFCSDGKIEAFLWQYWDVASSEWTDYRQNIFNYDTKGQIKAAVNYEADDNQVLSPVSRILYQYNDAGLLMSQLNQVFTADSWLNEYERTYVYGEKGHLSSASYWIHLGGASPIELSRVHYQYDSGQQLIVKLKWSYNYSNGQLNLEERDTFIYDLMGRLIEEVRNHYPVEEGWRLTYKTVYVYGDYYIPRMIQNFFKGRESDWSTSSQSEIDINQNRDITGLKMYTFSQQDSSFSPKLWYDFSRDKKIRLDNLNLGSTVWLDSWVFSNLAFQGSEPGTYAIQQYGLYYRDPETESWQSDDEEGSLFFYYSSSTTTSIKEPDKGARFSVYPNPADRLLTIETDLTDVPFDLYLYNMFGQRVFRKNISANEQVVLPDLPEGMYVLQLIKGNERLGSRRVMIRH